MIGLSPGLLAEPTKMSLLTRLIKVAASVVGVKIDIDPDDKDVQTKDKKKPDV